MIARPALRSAAVALAGGLVTLAAAALLGRLGHSLIEADESSHYINALFLGDWVRGGLASPMAYAVDYYLHYPRLSIQHWPPGWYLLETPLMALLRPSPFAMVIVTTMVAGSCAALVDWAVRTAGRPRLALAAALCYVLLPLVIDQSGYIMLDQPLTLIAGITAILWYRTVETPSLKRYFLVIGCAVLTLLVKGNGILIGLMPFLHIALTGRWALLRDRRPWIAIAVGLLIVVPWYAVTYKIAARGFNYQAGPEYAWLALQVTFDGLWQSVSIVGMAAAILGAAFAFRDRATRPAQWNVAALAVAMILACQLIFSGIPAALMVRYISAMLPWIVALGAIGLASLWQWRGATGKALAAISATMIAGNIAWADSRLDPKTDIGAEALTATMAAHPGLWMIDGRATGEGAVIAAIAWRDGPSRKIHLLRASQWLSQSDFMGRGYELTYKDPAQVRALLDRLGVVGVVSVREHDRNAYPHGPLLEAAVRQGFAIEKRRFLRREGHVFVAIRTAPIAAHPELIEIKSANVKTITGR